MIQGPRALHKHFTYHPKRPGDKNNRKGEEGCGNDKQRLHIEEVGGVVYDKDQEKKQNGKERAGTFQH